MIPQAARAEAACEHNEVPALIVSVLFMRYKPAND